MLSGAGSLFSSPRPVTATQSSSYGSIVGDGNLTHGGHESPKKKPKRDPKKGAPKKKAQGSEPKKAAATRKLQRRFKGENPIPNAPIPAGLDYPIYVTCGSEGLHADEEYIGKRK